MPLSDLGDGVSIEIRRAVDRFTTRSAWLTSRHSFSYGPHYDPDNVGHGPLLVSNEERVAAGTGFDLHPHRDAEILTWVLSGSLAHTDSEGRHGVVYPGLAQRMSAGRGINHSERNDAYRTTSTTGSALTDGTWLIDPERVVEPVHFVQMWVRPDQPGAEPSYQQDEIAAADLAAGWVPIASGGHPDAAISLGSADSTLWVSVLEPGERRVLPIGRRTHLFLARGDVHVEQVGELATGDAARVTGQAGLTITARTGAELLVWELNGA